MAPELSIESEVLFDTGVGITVGEEKLEREEKADLAILSSSSSC